MPDRPAWAQGPEWEKWTPVHCVGVVLLINGLQWFRIAESYWDDKNQTRCFSLYCRGSDGSIEHNSPNALRIYAEGLLRLEAELEAAE